jgi:hypothetical protein
MSTDALPASTLRQLRPADVRSYARTKGWHRTGTFRDNLAIFNLSTGGLDQLLVPSNVEFDDFTNLMQTAILKLSEIEERSPFLVLNDLLSADADVLRFSVRSPDTSRGTLPLEQGMNLFAGAKQSLLSAACSVLAPDRLHHPRMAFSEAEEFLRTCALGQTEEGSFTLTVRCPLHSADRQAEPVDSGAAPFARRATSVLAISAFQLVHAIDEDRSESLLTRNGDLPQVSANFCDALLRMRPETESASLALSIAWAPSLPQSPVIGYRPIVFRPDHFREIERVYKQLRGDVAPKAALFVGQVDELRGVVGDDGKRQGEVRLTLLHESETVKARANLTPAQYELADEAHMHSRQVVINGILSRGFRISTVSDITEFNLFRVETLPSTKQLP